MTFIELAKKRFSVRKYIEKPVENEKIEKILKAGQIAPSACNYQPWHFVIIQNKETLKKICETYKYSWLSKAPVIIAVCGDHNISWKRDDGKDFCDVDIAIAVDHMTLQATELGLGTCWIGMFDTRKCHELLELPENIELISLLPLGYTEKEPDMERHNKMRKNIDEIVHWEKW